MLKGDEYVDSAYILEFIDIVQWNAKNIFYCYCRIDWNCNH